MKHRSLTLITPEKPNRLDVQKEMMPFHEFERTGLDNSYVKNVDKTEEARALHLKCFPRETQPFLEFCLVWSGLPVIFETDVPDLRNRHQYGWIRIGDNADVQEIIYRTNPDRKWTSWEIGGRYRTFYQPKSGSSSDVSMRKDSIDFEDMYEKERQRASAIWENVHGLVGDFDNYNTLKVFKNDIYPNDQEMAYKAYSAQPQVQLIRSHGRDLSWLTIDHFTQPLEEYVTNRIVEQCMTNALLFGGTWYENDRDWDKTYTRVVDAAPDDYWFTVIDYLI